MTAMDLKDLLEQVKGTLEEGFPRSVWVRAEVASLQVRGTPARPGHCYMELCQSSPAGVVAKVRAIAWQYNWMQISRQWRSAVGGDIRPGIKILASVRVNFSEQYGLSLIIENIDPSYTLGDAEQKRRETIARLQRENLLDLQKRLPLSPLPRNLAVISSGTAAGYGDFCHHLQENEYGFRFRVRLFDALMQGDGAPASIADALGRIEDACAESDGDPDALWDAVLILRGGGSALDLGCFDDYGLCAAIARCPVPVFTAIGHDRDTHVADMVAWESVKTPTALADLFVSAFAAEDERICAFGTRLRLAFSARISACETAVERLRGRIRISSVGKVMQHSSAIGALASRIRLSSAGRVMLQMSALERLEARIKAADPRAVLSRGFTLTTDAAGVVRKSSAAFSEGDSINILFPDGTLNCTVNGKRKL